MPADSEFQADRQLCYSLKTEYLVFSLSKLDGGGGGERWGIQTRIPPHSWLLCDNGVISIVA